MSKQSLADRPKNNPDREERLARIGRPYRNRRCCLRNEKSAGKIFPPKTKRGTIRELFFDDFLSAWRHDSIFAVGPKGGGILANRPVWVKIRKPVGFSIIFPDEDCFGA